MRQLSLDHLQTLVAIADLGTFSAAAQALHLAQPTVSLHISELEARMNTSLLVRGGRRVTPSAAGELLIEHARRLLRAADEALTAMKLHWVVCAWVHQAVCRFIYCRKCWKR